MSIFLFFDFFYNARVFLFFSSLKRLKKNKKINRNEKGRGLPYLRFIKNELKNYDYFE